MVPVDPDGAFCVYTSAAVHLVVDVQGSFNPTDGLGFTSTAPVRRLDTRQLPQTKPTAGSITRVETGEVGASAVLANLTMVAGTTGGYITADKCSTLMAGPQSKSNGNYPATFAIANLAVVPVDVDGAFCIYTSSSVHLIADVQGSFGATGLLHFYPTDVDRAIDTRVQ